NAIALYRKVDDVRARTGEVDVLRKVGEYDDALTMIDATIATEGPGSPSTAGLWYQRGRTLLARGQVDEAVEALERGFLVAAVDDPVLCMLVVTLADAMFMNGRTVDALQFGLFGRRMFERTGDLSGLAAALRVVGNSHVGLEDFDEA